MSASGADRERTPPAADPTDASRATPPRWTVRGVALADVSAAAGAVVWTGLRLAGLLGPIEGALALAPLVLVPLGTRMAARPRFRGRADRVHAAATLSQPVGALLVTLSLVVGSGPAAAALAAPWVVVTALLGLAGFARVRQRLAATGRDGSERPRDALVAPETLVDAGFMYVTVGSTALVLSQLGITFWFDPVVVLLTAVHFHYAGFALPVFTGLSGRCLGPTGDRMYRPLAGAVLVGPALIAVGIAVSPVVEVVAVGVFTAAVAALGGYVAVVVAPGRPLLQRSTVRVAALALPVSMALALGYGIGAFTGTTPLGLDLGTMVALHGSLNAYGFGLLGLAGWRLSVPVGAERLG